MKDYMQPKMVKCLICEEMFDASQIHRFELGKEDGQWIISGEIFKMLGVTKVKILNAQI